jgi:hypothetical protein
LNQLAGELPRRFEYLQTCETHWWKARFNPSPAEKEFLSIKELANTTIAELIRDLEYLGNNDDDIANAVSNIKKGFGDDDISVDIKALCILCEKEKDKLAAIGSDPQLLIDIDYCDERYPLCHSMNEIDTTHFSALYNRNCAYTLLLVAIEEIRRCARHAFWNDKKHLKGYLSDYFRRRGE